MILIPNLKSIIFSSSCQNISETLLTARYWLGIEHLTLLNIYSFDLRLGGGGATRPSKKFLVLKSFFDFVKITRLAIANFAIFKIHFWKLLT